MMLRFHVLYAVVILALSLPLVAQTVIETPAQADSLRNVLLSAQNDHANDTTRVNAMNDLSWYYHNVTSTYDSALYFAREAQRLAERGNFTKGIARASINIGNVYLNQSKYIESLGYLVKALQLCKQSGDQQGITIAMNAIAIVYYNQGNYVEALKYHFQALRIREALGDTKGVAASFNNIANVYYNQGKYNESLEYNYKSLRLKEQLGNNQGIASSLNNIANVYFEQGKLAEALDYHTQALHIRETIGNKQGIASSLGNIANVYYRQGKYVRALDYHLKSLQKQSYIGDKQGIAISLINIGNVYAKQNKYDSAIAYNLRSLRLADSIEARATRKDALEALSVNYDSLGQAARAFAYYRQYVALKDSLVNIENLNKASELQETYNAEKREQQITLQESDIARRNVVQWSLVGVLAVVSIAAVSFGRLYRQKLRANMEILRQQKVLEDQSAEIELINTSLQQAHEESESLLLNILPAPIAYRLKSGERAIADRFDSVTVLFADIVGFTNLSARTTPEELVQGLNAIFGRFDTLARAHGLEKIKTIGDAYMVAGGLPARSDKHDHAERVARFALDILAATGEETLRTSRGETVQLRIGIHTGEAVAGVIGTSKFAYDLWGDTVNTASRMESHGEPGRIHITREVHDALNGAFAFEQRGKIEVKGKGMMQTWFLKGAKP
jgi:adenylate cyclase